LTLPTHTYTHTQIKTTALLRATLYLSFSHVSFDQSLIVVVSLLITLSIYLSQKWLEVHKKRLAQNEGKKNCGLGNLFTLQPFTTLTCKTSKKAEQISKSAETVAVVHEECRTCFFPPNYV